MAAEARRRGDEAQPLDRRPLDALVTRQGAIHGIAVLLPQYFLEAELGRRFPPPPNHPEQFYGFLGVALAWQFAFLLISDRREHYICIKGAAIFALGHYIIIGNILLRCSEWEAGYVFTTGIYRAFSRGRFRRAF